MARAYLLKFLDSQERAVRELKIEADDEQSAITYSCEQSVRFGMAVELCCEDMSILRVTPMTARLYLPDREWSRA